MLEQTFPTRLERSTGIYKYFKKKLKTHAQEIRFQKPCVHLKMETIAVCSAADLCYTNVCTEVFPRRSG